MATLGPWSATPSQGGVMQRCYIETQAELSAWHRDSGFCDADDVRRHAIIRK